MSFSPSPNEVVMDAAFQATTFDLLEIDVPGAHVQLRPHDEDDRVHIRGFVPNIPSETARTRFDRKGIATFQSGDQLHLFGDPLSTDVEDWRWRHTHRTAVHLDIRLPPNLDVMAQTPGGSVDAADLSGTIDLTVRGGSATTMQMNGPLKVQGGGGSLTIRDCAESTLDLQWTAGPVTLEQIAGPSTSLHAASAPSTLQDLHGSVDLTVHGAPLTLRNLDGPCEATVRGGTLTYHGAPTEHTALTTVGGSLQSHLPPSHAASLTLTGDQVTLDEAFPFDGKRTAHRIEGTLNGGGPRLRLHAIQGTAHCGAASKMREEYER